MEKSISRKLLSACLVFVLCITTVFMNVEVASAESKTTADGQFSYSIVPETIGLPAKISIEKYLKDESVVNIPETIEGLSVDFINQNAFKEKNIRDLPVEGVISGTLGDNINYSYNENTGTLFLSRGTVEAEASDFNMWNTFRNEIQLFNVCSISNNCI